MWLYNWRLLSTNTGGTFLASPLLCHPFLIQLETAPPQEHGPQLEIMVVILLFLVNTGVYPRRWKPSSSSSYRRRGWNRQRWLRHSRFSLFWCSLWCVRWRRKIMLVSFPWHRLYKQKYHLIFNSYLSSPRTPHPSEPSSSTAEAQIKETERNIQCIL